MDCLTEIFRFGDASISCHAINIVYAFTAAAYMIHHTDMIPSQN